MIDAEPSLAPGDPTRARRTRAADERSRTALHFIIERDNHAEAACMR